MSNESKKYQFQIVNGQVSAVFEIEGNKREFERMERDESWSVSSDGRTVTKSEMDDGRIEVSTFTDVDGDGYFHKTGKSYSGHYSGQNNAGQDSHYESDSDDHGVSTIVSNPSGPQATVSQPQAQESGYSFRIQNDEVVGVSRVRGEVSRGERMDPDEEWFFDGLDVIKTEVNRNSVKTTIFADPNNNGVFQDVFEIEVLTSPAARGLERYSFKLTDGSNATGGSLLESDLIASQHELTKRGWKFDHLDANEELSIIEVDGTYFIVKTEQERSGELEFSLFIDEDDDGLWTEIAEGQTQGDYLDLAGQIDLVGMIDDGLLLPATPFFI